MKRTLDNSKKYVLYHAVSTYQLLEVMLHRIKYHQNAYSVLLLPDFIIKKFPSYRRLEKKGFFDRVFLFPYLKIPHSNDNSAALIAENFYKQTVPFNIKTFSSIYIAGAHFYFSLFLIKNNIPFDFFEDAAGMLSRPDKLYDSVAAKFPLHAKTALKYGLFDASSPFIKNILCLKKAQTTYTSDEKFIDFSVERELADLCEKKRKKIIRLFINKKIRSDADVILLTQHYSNLGLMSEKKQLYLYSELNRKLLKNHNVIIKKHPDDNLNYKTAFPKAKVIKPVFPSELLPYVFVSKPEYICSFDSTGCENLKNHFKIIKAERKQYD